MLKSRSISVLLVLIFILAACAPATASLKTSATVTPTVPTNTPTPTLIPTPTRPSMPAPAIPDVSAAISVENVSKLTRLTSLGEGDIMNMQVSPDEKWVVLGTSNGVLVLDSTTMQKVLWLPTEMKARHVTFIENGSKLIAWDCIQGYSWSFPSGKEVSRFKYQLVSSWAKYDPLIACTSVPDKDWKYAFASTNPYVMWGRDDYPTDYEPVTGLYEIQTGEIQYTLDYEVQYFSVSSDEKFVALDTGDKLVIIQYQDGKVVQEIPETGIKSLLYMPGGKILVSIYNNQVKFLNTEDLSLINSAAVYEVQSATASPDGRILAVRTKNDDRFYNAEDGTLLGAFSSGSYLFTPDSGGVLLDPGKGQVQYYQINTDGSKLELIRSFAGQGPRGWFGTLSQIPGVLSSDGSLLMLTNGNYMIENGFNHLMLLVYDFNSGSLLNQIPMSSGTNPFPNIANAIWVPAINSFALMVTHYYAQTDFSTVDLKSKSIVEVINRDSDSFFSNDINFSHDGELLISVQGNRLLSWDLKNYNYWRFIEYSDPWTGYGYNGRVDFSTDDKEFAVRDSQMVTHFFNTSDYSRARDPFNGKYLFLNSGYFATADGIFLGETPTLINSFSISNANYDFNEAENLLAVIDNGLAVMKFSDDYSSVETIFSDSSSFDWWVVSKLSPDGKFVAAERKSGLSVWNIQSSELACELDNGWGRSNYVFSPDSRMIAVGKDTTASSMVSIFEIEGCKELFTTGGYFSETSDAPSVAFSPDGKYLAILTKFGYPQIWGIP